MQRIRQSRRIISITVPIVAIWMLLCFAGAGDQNFHTICVFGGSDQLNGGKRCLNESDFIRRRDECSLPLGKCFGVDTDGWDVDVIGSGRCVETPNRGCSQTPFKYAALEYRSNEGDKASAWQPDQRKAIIAAIHQMGRVHVVIFVHGWNHDAREETDRDIAAEKEDETQDEHLRNFKFILAKTQWELRKQGEANPNVFGIYVGWNGSAGQYPFSIGSRARAADRIAASQDFGDDLQAIVNVVLTSHSDNRLLIIGHSLGGRILSRYLLGTLTKKDAFHASDMASILGNRVLFATVNPAIGADAFDDYWTHSLKGTELPLWINITNEIDFATGRLFLVAATVGKLLAFGYGISDKTLSISSVYTIGHYREYQTHRLEFGKYEAPCKGPNPRVDVSFTDYPPVLSDRTSLWYKINSSEKGNVRSIFFGDGTDCDAAYYWTKLSRVDKSGKALHAVQGSMWNIVSDADLIDCGVNARRRPNFCTHNAFVQTSLIRMLIELQVARARQQAVRDEQL